MARPKAAGSVRAFLDALDHPRRRTVPVLHDVLLGIDPSIGEEIK